jgi:hypothetical protein
MHFEVLQKRYNIFLHGHKFLEDFWNLYFPQRFISVIFLQKSGDLWILYGLFIPYKFPAIISPNTHFEVLQKRCNIFLHGHKFLGDFWDLYFLQRFISAEFLQKS